MLFSKLLEVGKNYYFKNAVIHDKRKISYGELLVQVNRLTQKLKEQGMKRYSRIAILSNNSIEYMIAFYSISKLGAIAIPIDIRFKKHEVEKMINMFDVEYCIYFTEEGKNILDSMTLNSTLKEGLYEFRYEEISIEEDIKDEMQDIIHNVQNQDDFLIQYTSGSTGVPKGIIHTQLSLSCINNNWSTTIGVSEHDEFLCTYVLTAAHATDIFILPALLNGATMHIIDIEKVFPRFVANYISNHKITVYTSLDYFFRLLNEDIHIKKEQLQSLRRVLSGSAPLTEDVGKTFYNKFEIHLGNIYGMAETGPSHVNLHEGKEIKYSSVGRPLNNMEVKVVNEVGETVDYGEIGEILLKSKSIAKGYWNNSVETKKVFREDNWVSTKDFGYQDSEGNYYIVGRKSQFVNINGNKVSPDEVEEVINSYEAIKECGVIGVQKGTTQEALVAFIVPKHDMDMDDLKSYCSQYLANYKMCKEYLVLEELPRGETGKLLKSKLEELYVLLKKRVQRGCNK